MIAKIFMLVLSLILIITISMQESKSDSGIIGGGAEQLFGTRTSRGYDRILHRITLVCVTLYFIVAFLSLFLEDK